MENRPKCVYRPENGPERAGNLRTFCPDPLELRRDRRRFFRVLALPPQTVCQTVKRPAVIRKTREILTVNLLCFGITAMAHQSGAERMPHRDQPSRRLIIVKSILQLGRFA